MNTDHQVPSDLPMDEPKPHRTWPAWTIGCLVAILLAILFYVSVISPQFESVVHRDIFQPSQSDPL